jgi:hypothetical protein
VGFPVIAVADTMLARKEERQMLAQFGVCASA